VPSGDRINYKRRLKVDLYGADRVPLVALAGKGREAAERLRGQLDDLAQLFPGGFAPMLEELRSWGQPGLRP